MNIPREQITGLLLAGGQGSRMDGRDKGLQLLHGEPLAVQVLRRLTPQVGTCVISANRHLDAYRQWGCEVFSDLPSLPPAFEPHGPPNSDNDSIFSTH